MTNFTVESCSELMQNYLQADAISPEGKFQALCTATGSPLLFSVGVGEGGRRAFYLTAESPADRYGWKRSDLSSALVGHEFPKGADVNNFSVAQTAHGAGAGSLRLAAVINDGAADHLYLSLGNSDRDTAWSKAPAWTACPFDAANDGHPDPSRLKIVDVFLSEASDNDYIVVDVARNPQSPVLLVSRYFIDVTDPTHPTWRLHDISFDLEAGKYSTCVGRPDPNTSTERRHPIDGLYTSGEIGGQPQLLYTPLYNLFDPSAPPTPRRLHLVGDRTPTAIAACRKPDDTSDLFATADGVLYYFASANQTDGATAVALVTSPFFVGASHLFASVADDVVTVWGLNANREVFQLRCPAAQLLTPASWSVPLPIMSAVDSVAPFVNRANGALTTFAHAGSDQLKIAVKSPGAVGTWTVRDVVLPPASTTQPASSFTSYTTRIQVSDASGRPAPGVTVRLTTENHVVTSAYINHLYYVIGQAPVELKTDTNGTITVVEAVARLDATRFTASVVGGGNVQVNPMQDAPTSNKKLRTLNSESSLRDAVIQYQDPAKNPPKKLIKSTASDSDISATAANVDNLWQAHDNLHNKSVVGAAPLTAPNLSAYRAFVGAQTPTRVDAGDLFMMLESHSEQRVLAARSGLLTAEQVEKSGWETFVDWFLDLGKRIWRVIVRIGELIFEAVLDVIEKVYAAFKYVFDKIVEVIEDVIDFVKFLFDVEDMQRTKDVFKNVLKVFLYEQVNQIEVVKGKFDDAANKAIQAINGWAGLDDFGWVGRTKDAQLPDPSASAFGKTAPETLLSHHYQANATRSNFDPAPSTTPPSSVLEALENAASAETAALGSAFDQLTDIIKEGASMSTVEILKALVGIVGDLALKSSKVVIDALFDVMRLLAKAALDAVDYPIHIPVVSDILNAFGIPDFSLLDILCWVVAVPVTIVYKIAMGIAGRGETSPLPDSPETTFLKTVTDFAALARAFGVGAERARLADPAAHSLALELGAPPINLSHNWKKSVSFMLHAAAGLGGVFSAVIDPIEGAIPNNDVTTKMAIMGGSSALLGGGSRALANYLVPRCPVKDERLFVYNMAVTVPFLFNKFFWGMHDKWRPPLEITEDPRKWGALCDSFLALCAMGGSIWHFIELSSEPEGWDRSSAILDEISMLSSCCARIGYAAMVSGLIEDPESLALVGLGVTVANGGFATFQFAEAGVELVSPWE